jgi:hypothetical protein
MRCTGPRLQRLQCVRDWHPSKAKLHAGTLMTSPGVVTLHLRCLQVHQVLREELLPRDANFCPCHLQCQTKRLRRWQGAPGLGALAICSTSQHIVHASKLHYHVINCCRQPGCAALSVHGEASVCIVCAGMCKWVCLREGGVLRKGVLLRRGAQLASHCLTCTYVPPCLVCIAAWVCTVVEPLHPSHSRC